MDDDAIAAAAVDDDDTDATVAAVAWTLFWTAKFYRKRSGAVSERWWAPDPPWEAPLVPA